MLHIGDPSYLRGLPLQYFLWINLKSFWNVKRQHFMRHSRSMLCICYSLSSHACMGGWELFKFRAVKIVIFGPQHDWCQLRKTPFLLYNCVCIVFEQILDWRGESRRKTPEDTQASEVQWMKYFVGTALGKLTSTVLGNALGTAQGGAT